MEQPCHLLESLPEEVLLTIVSCLKEDIVSLCHLAQCCKQLYSTACTPKLWSHHPNQHARFCPFDAAVRSCLSSILHLPPQIFHTTFSPSRSRKFPLLLHAHNLKYVVASGDADSIAACLSSDLQACIDHVPSHALSTPSRPALPTAALLSVCRSDGGSVRVCPYPATVMAAALRQLARIPMPAAGPGQQLQGCRVGAQGDGCLAALLGQLQHALLPRDASGVSDGSHGSDKDGRIHHSGGGCMADAHTHGSAASSSIGMHTSEVISQRTVQGTADDRACADAHSRPGPRAACRPHDRALEQMAAALLPMLGRIKPELLTEDVASSLNQQAAHTHTHAQPHRGAASLPSSWLNTQSDASLATTHRLTPSAHDLVCMAAMVLEISTGVSSAQVPVAGATASSSGNTPSSSLSGSSSLNGSSGTIPGQLPLFNHAAGTSTSSNTVSLAYNTLQAGYPGYAAPLLGLASLSLSDSLPSPPRAPTTGIWLGRTNNGNPVPNMSPFHASIPGIINLSTGADGVGGMGNARSSAACTLPGGSLAGAFAGVLGAGGSPSNAGGCGGYGGGMVTVPGHSARPAGSGNGGTVLSPSVSPSASPSGQGSTRRIDSHSTQGRPEETSHGAMQAAVRITEAFARLCWYLHAAAGILQEALAPSLASMSSTCGAASASVGIAESHLESRCSSSEMLMQLASMHTVALDAACFSASTNALMHMLNAIRAFSACLDVDVNTAARAGCMRCRPASVHALLAACSTLADYACEALKFEARPGLLSRLGVVMVASDSALDGEHLCILREAFTSAHMPRAHAASMPDEQARALLRLHMAAAVLRPLAWCLGQLNCL